jgi:acetyl esterase/lipase
MSPGRFFALRAARGGRKARGMKPRLLEDIAYGPDPKHRLDLYLPPGDGKAKLVVFLHGGGWVRGSKEAGRRLVPALTGQGYALASLNYRLHPTATPESAIADAAQGIAYLCATKPGGIDTSAFALIGHSVGGQIAALLAMDATYFRTAGIAPQHLAALIALDGLFDVSTQLRDHPSPELSEIFGTAPARWDNLSPMHHVPSMPKHLAVQLLYGDVHKAFPKHAALFAAALTRHGRDVEAARLPGLAHMELLKQFPVLAPKVLSHLNQHLLTR